MLLLPGMITAVTGHFYKCQRQRCICCS